MLRRLILFLVGTLRIEVTGGQVAEFLNLCLDRRITLWEIERRPERMYATLTLHDFFALRPVARGSRCRVRIRGRRGFPFLALRLRRRPLLLLGAVACLAAILWASSQVWLIEVRISGPHQIDPRAIRAVAAEAGLRRGAWKAKLDLPQVAQHLRARIGELSWAVIRVQGTRAIIEVVEKAAIKPADPAACVHLVARKSGVVEQVVPFQGEPLVRQGAVVNRGDMLVECALRYWSGGRPGVVPGTEPPPRQDLARTLVAQASVKARIGYRSYKEYPLEREVAEPTGRREVQWVLKVYDLSILLRGKETTSFAHSQTSERVIPLGKWRNWKSPVELVMREHAETAPKREPIPLEEALAAAKAAMAAHLAWVLGPADKVVQPMQAQVVEQTKEFAGILVTVETLEEIAVPLEGAGPVQPTPPPEPQGQ